MMMLVSMLASAFLCLAGLASCSWHAAERDDSRLQENFARTIGQNRCVAILPFAGDEDNPQLASKVRQSFYSHFSAKKYYAVKPYDVDAMLEGLDAGARGSWHKMPPVELGKCFKADYLIYGTVLRTRRLFYVLYSQLALEVELRIVETRQGKTVWQTSLEKRLQSGDMPLHPLALVTAAVRTGVDASDERMQDLIERTCRELADRIPEPPEENKNTQSTDIQVASFESPERAQQLTARLEEKGYRARIERVRIKGVEWNRVMLGPFSRDDAERTRQQLAAEPGARPVLLQAR